MIKLNKNIDDLTIAFASLSMSNLEKVRDEFDFIVRHLENF